jgi:hypothetical protein
MTIFGEIEQFISEELYAYRWPIVIGLIVAAVAVLVVAYRQRWHLALWKHKLASAIVGVPLLVVSVIAGDYFLSPLFERSLACEASPIAGAGSGSDECAEAVSVGQPQDTEGPTESPVAAEPTSSPTEAAAFEAQVVRQGEFRGADDFHFGEGTALLIETAPGEYTLRFEEFSVRNGPDLFVYLSVDPEGDVAGALNLGDLKATDGAFNYEVPTNTDVSKYASAMVWCKEFGVLFAVAPLAGE